MNNTVLKKAKVKGIYYEFIDKDKLFDNTKIDFLQTNITNDENNKKILLEKKIKIENMLKNILTNSKENIKSTVPIINNVNKQLMQDNLLLKIKIENMKQTYKNIINYCCCLKKDKGKNNEINEIVNGVLERLKYEMEKVKEE